MLRIYRALAFLVLLAHAPILLKAQEAQSPWEGVWTGKEKSLATDHPYNDFQFHVEGNQLTGIWERFRATTLVGTITGDTVVGTYGGEGGSDFKMKMVNSEKIKFNIGGFMGIKYDLERTNRSVARPQRGESRPSFLNQVAASINNSGIGSLPQQNNTGTSNQQNYADQSQKCGAYELGTIGSGSAGMVCRCSISPNGQVGWWEVQAGRMNSNISSCSPPGGGIAYAAAASTSFATPDIKFGTVNSDYPPSPATTNNQMASTSPRMKVIPNANKCLDFKTLRSNEGRTWFSLTNKCSETITAHWCASNGERCKINESWEIEPGRSFETWFTNSQYSGVSRMACQIEVNEKRVQIDIDNWNCYIMD